MKPDFKTDDFISCFLSLSLLAIKNPPNSQNIFGFKKQFLLGEISSVKNGLVRKCPKYP